MKDLEAGIVRRLRCASGYTTRRDLAGALTVSTGEVAKTIGSLRLRGYRIDEVPGEGYRLIESPAELHEADVKRRLEGLSLGGEVHVLGRVASTNDTALGLARKGAGEGALVLAEEQSQGRGRLHRKWHSAPGLGLWFSVVLRPDLGAPRSALVSLAGALGVATALRREWGVRAEVKWPNDIVVGGKKICGVLSEGEFSDGMIKFTVLGIGLNALHAPEDFPPDIRGMATSVKLETGREVSRLDLLASVLGGIEAKYRVLRSAGFDGLRSELIDLSSLIGKLTRVMTGASELEGTVVGLDENGALVIRLESGQLRSLVAGEVVRVS